MTEDALVAIQKSQAKHDKEFHKGMDWFTQGYDRPKESSPILAGWLAAKEMAEVKTRYLNLSRNQFNQTK